MRNLDQTAKDFVAANFVPSEILDNEIDLMRYLKIWTASWVPRVTGPIVNKLRTWSSGAGAQGFEALLPVDEYWRMNTRELFEIFSSFQFGAICGHVAWTLMSVYESFGFKAYTYNYGAPPPVSFHP